MDVPTDRSKNLDAALKEKAVEHLVAASCILISDLELNVSTSYVDDEEVDLVFHRRVAQQGSNRPGGRVPGRGS